MKSGNLNILEPSGPLQACNGSALPLYKSALVGKIQWIEMHGETVKLATVKF